jgi:crotonobetainyl-CoA:carnitine CoA-transferase CaiB-like acyl-CoA transferase
MSQAKDRQVTGQEIADWTQWLRDRGAPVGKINELAQTLNGKSAEAASQVIVSWILSKNE